jgi:branched-chain amino acid transport system substrate-binding protein
MKRAEKVNLKVVAVEAFMAGERDFNSMITKIRQSNPDVITVISQAADAALIGKQIRQLGWNVKISYSGGAYSPQLINLGGAELEGAYIDAPFFVSANDAKGQEFVKEFEKRANYIAPAHAQYSYDATRLVLEAIERADKAGALNRKKVRDEIVATKDFPGYSGPITFTPAGDVHKKYVILQIEGGKFKQLTDYSFMNQ